MTRRLIFGLVILCLLLPALAMAAPVAKELGVIDYVELSQKEYPVGVTEIPITIGIAKPEAFLDTASNPGIYIEISDSYDTIYSVTIKADQISDGMTYIIKPRRPLEEGYYYLSISYVSDTDKSYYDTLEFGVADHTGDFDSSNAESVTNLVVPTAVENVSGGKAVISFTANIDYEAELTIMVLDSNKNNVAVVAMETLYEGKKNYSYTWNLTSTDGKRLSDGLYYIVVSVEQSWGTFLLPADEHPVMLGKKPELTNVALSATATLLEYLGAPKVTFTSNTAGKLTTQVFDESGKAIDSYSFTISPGESTSLWDYFTSDKKLIKPGKYAYKITLSNDFGKAESKTFSFNVKQAPALTMTFNPEPTKTVINPWNIIKLYLNSNINTQATITISDANGNKLGNVLENGFIAKGARNTGWNLRDGSNKLVKGGKYRIDITAVSITGEKKTANATVQLTAPPAIKISGTSLSPASVTAGGNAVFKGTLNTEASITGYVLNSNNKTVLTLFSDVNVKSGEFDFTVGTAALSGGSYTVVFEATNGSGTAKASKQLTVKSPPKPPAKMNIVSLESYSDGTYEVFTASYEGAGELTLTIYGPNGKAVRTVSKTVTGSGTWTYRWDYRGANGVYSQAGEHKATIAGKNAGGTSSTVNCYFVFN